jgi:hypothetical protein
METSKSVAASQVTPVRLTKRHAFTLLCESNSGPTMSATATTCARSAEYEIGNWYVHLARFGHQQIVLATSERSLLTVLLPARQLREGTEISFQAAVAELLAALQLPEQIVSRELAAAWIFHLLSASSRHLARRNGKRSAAVRLDMHSHLLPMLQMLRCGFCRSSEG